MNVVKYSGESELFSEEKLTRSLLNSGVDDRQLESIISGIRSDIYEGITTKKLFQIATKWMKKYAPYSVPRYKLKAVIHELGPLGFRSFISELLKYQGFEVMTKLTIKGRCITHEIDLVAEKANQHFIIGCKFHNRPGYKADVKVPLYINSRFRDVEFSWRNMRGHRDKFHQGWVVTNGKFTTDAIAYGKCAGLRMISWDYPEGDSLKDMILEYGLHPVTSLSTLTRAQKSELLSRGIVLCRTICDHPDVLRQFLPENTNSYRILKEAHSTAGCIQTTPLLPI